VNCLGSSNTWVYRPRRSLVFFYTVLLLLPQVVVIVEIFVAEHWSMKALTNELLNGVFDIAQVTMVNETGGKIS
jgi:hypothetical protein